MVFSATSPNNLVLQVSSGFEYEAVIEVFSTDWPLGAGQDKCGRDDGADSLRTQPNTV